MKHEVKPTLYDLIGSIYDAGLHPERWHDTFDQLGSHFNSRAGGIFSSEFRVHTVDVMLYGGELDTEQPRLYNDYFIAKDVRLIPDPRPGAVGADNLMPGFEERQWRESELYCDYYRPLGVYYRAVALLARNGKRTTILWFQRRKRDGGYTIEEMERLHLLTPHLVRALEISSQFTVKASQEPALAVLLERSRCAVFLLNAQGRVVRLNRRAESLLRDRVDLRMAQGQLAVTNPPRQVQLAGLVQESLRTATGTGLRPGGRMVIEPEDGTPGMVIVVTPLNTAYAQWDVSKERICAAVTVSVPSNPGLSEEVLVTWFSLTRAEAKVAAALAGGLSPKEIGTALHITTNTAYTHLRTIYAKTGTSRQAELVQLLLSSPAADAGWIGETGGAASA